MEGPAVLSSTIRLAMEAPPSPLSSRPKRTRISCHAALDKTTCAPFRKEGRMKRTNATKFTRKFGIAERRDLQFCRPFLEMFFDTSPVSEPCAATYSPAQEGRERHSHWYHSAIQSRTTPAHKDEEQSCA